IQERQRGWIVNGRIDSALGKELLQSVSPLGSDDVEVIDVRSTRTHARQHQITDALEQLVVACGDTLTFCRPRGDVFQLCAQQRRMQPVRSEERRVGKECRSRWWESQSNRQ